MKTLPLSEYLELEEKQKRLELTLSSLEIGCWEIDPNTMKFQIDDRVYKLWGLDRISFPDPLAAAKKAIHPEDFDSSFSKFFSCIAEGRDVLLEYRVIRPNGSVAVLTSIGKIEFDASGKPTRVRGLISDSTARQLAENERRSLQDRMELALSGSGFGVWEMDMQQGRLIWDQRMFALYGHSEESFNGDPEIWRACLHPDDREIVDARFADLLCGKNVDLFEFRIRRFSDQEIRIIEANGIARMDQNGRVIRLVGMNRDITEFRQAQQEAKRGEDRFRDLVDATAGIVWEGLLKGDVFQFSYVSQHAERLLGHPVESWIRDTNFWFHQLHPDDRHRAIDFCLRETRLGRAHTFEYRIYDASRNLHWFREYVNVSKQSKDIFIMRGIMVDITNEKLSTELLQKQQVILTSNAKFAALGEMAAGMAHEINNPLTVILSQCRQIQNQINAGDPSPQAILPKLEKISSTADRISKIVRGLRTFSRQSERDPPQSASIADIVGETLGLCREKFKVAGICLETALGQAAESRVMCRLPQITQVLLNLLNNSFDAIENLDDKWVRISARLADDRVLISICDSGSGLNSEFADRIMEPFFTTKSADKGTGLGLSISKGIVESHGGRLFWDESSKNTCFVVDLPALKN